MLKLGELGEMSFGPKNLGEQGEMSFRSMGELQNYEVRWSELWNVEVGWVRWSEFRNLKVGWVSELKKIQVSLFGKVNLGIVMSGELGEMSLDMLISG